MYGPQCAYRGDEADPCTGATLGVAPALGLMACRLAALGVLAAAGPAALQAQIGLASGGAQIALIARVPLRASINVVGPAPETARRSVMSEGTVKLRLSANNGYRLVVVGTDPVRSSAGPASRLWVRAENGRFEELKSGAVVTVVRGRHTAGEWEPEVSFRREAFGSIEGSDVLPVRYEVRIDPVI